MKTSALAFPLIIAAALALSACAKGAGDANVTVSNDIAADGGNLTDTPSEESNSVDANLADVPANAL